MTISECDLKWRLEPEPEPSAMVASVATTERVELQLEACNVRR